MKATSKAAICAALGMMGISLACGTNNSGGPGVASDVGQSCVQTADCKAGLACVGDVCVAAPFAAGAGSSGSSGSGSGTSSSSSSSSSSGSGNSSSGSSSGSGSSSTSSSGSSSGAPEAAPPRLGAFGDVCMNTAQCAAGLECLPLQVQGSSGVIAPLALGTCQLSNYGLDGSVTGKTCGGECNTRADCCVLPPNVTVNGMTYHSCLDIQTNVIAGGNCSALANGDSSPLGIGCFYYQTYCNGCGSSGSAWACTNNQCVYAAACQASDLVVGGCAPLSRTGRVLSTSCTNHACSTTPAAVCSTNLDCAGQAYVPYTIDTPYSTSPICTAEAGASTDCVCSAGSCYLACSVDLDCAGGYSCDSTTHLCKYIGGCTTDAQCVKLKYNQLAMCVKSACIVPCSTDSDCNPAGTAGFTGQACTNGTCQPVGCSTDADCNVASGGGPRTFCVAPAPTVTAEVSAITN